MKAESLCPMTNSSSFRGCRPRERWRGKAVLPISSPALFRHTPLPLSFPILLHPTLTLLSPPLLSLPLLLPGDLALTLCACACAATLTLPATTASSRTLAAASRAGPSRKDALPRETDERTELRSAMVGGVAGSGWDRGSDGKGRWRSGRSGWALTEAGTLECACGKEERRRWKW